MHELVRKAVVVLLLSCCSLSAQTPAELKKEASRLFEDEEYTRAYKLYSQLVANYPKDPEYNYRLGVCMIFSEPDKKKCIQFLRQASTDPKEAPKDLYFFLGKAYHINYLFDEALAHYNTFKKNSSASLQRKLGVDREIAACNNGKKLLSNLTDVVVQNKKELNESDYFRSYDLRTIGGKLLVKPDEFKTSVDKKKKEKSVVFLPRNSNVVYFSSYGDNTENGKDIYTAYKLPGGDFSKPERLKGINTPFDEDYPFLHPDGITLYFASKGYNSMGGYDIFMTRYDESSGNWTTPENLEFPINSPDDDFLFVTDSLKQTAYFSTGRQSPPGKIDVLKVRTERKPIDVLAVNGSVMKETESQSVRSIISVKNLETGLPLGTFNADEEGKYDLELPNGSKLLFTVETPGLGKQMQEVVLPLITASRPCNQIISYNDGKLKIENSIDPPNEDTYKQYLKVIAKKARLDVNEGENKLEKAVTTPTLAAETPVADVTPKKKESRPELIELDTLTSKNTSGTTPAAEKPAQGTDNKALAAMAEKEADELKQESRQLRSDARDAYETAKAQFAGGQAKRTEAAALTASADTLDGGEKMQALSRAETLKKEAVKDSMAGIRIEQYARSLEGDAARKEQESQLNAKYARELQNSLTARNKEESMKKIAEIQKELESISGSGNTDSESIVAGIRNDIENKEKELSKIEQDLLAAKSENTELRNGIATRETELAGTRKKSAKEKLSEEINVQKNLLSESDRLVALKEAELGRVSEEMSALRNQADLAQKIKTEDLTPVVTQTAAPPPVAAAPAALTAAELKTKYSGGMKPSNIQDVSSIEQSTSSLKEYNAEIARTIESNRSQLTRTKDPKKKQQLTAENKQLETARTANLKAIADNDRQLAALNSKPTSAPEEQGLAPVVAGSPAEAAEKLTQLSKKMDVYENENFDYNAYTDPKAQALKTEADARINDAIARQKKLKEEIRTASEEIGNSPAGADRNWNDVHREVEDLQAQAQQKRKEALSSEGAAREKLMAEAKQLEAQSMDKQLVAQQISQHDNQKVYDVNSENVKTLLATGKAPGPDADEATRLNNEAATAFKQASEIRKEAETLTGKGAKIGAITNAEEKEAEALLKQQQAIVLLSKTNPDVQLKTAVTSTNAAPQAGPDLAQQLEKVNTGLSEVIQIKNESYEKLFDANSTEAEVLTQSLKGNNAVTPGGKTNLLSAEKKLKEAAALRQQATAAATPSEKLALMTGAIKKQNEAVKQLNEVTKSTPPSTPPVVSAPEEPVAGNPVNAVPEETIAVAPGTVTLPANTETTGPAVIENPTTPTVEIADNTPVNLPAEIVNADPSPAAVVSDLGADPVAISNQEAGIQAKIAIEKLTQLESELGKAANPGEDKTSGMSVDEIRRQNETLLAEADALNEKAFETKRNAAGKSEEEQQAASVEAKKLQAQAQQKTVDAAEMMAAANDREIRANGAAITELLGRVRKENPTLASDLNVKNNEVETAGSQARQFRKEARQITSNAARIGAASNAEEKESEFIQKQKTLLDELKKQYPDYVVAPAVTEGGAAPPAEEVEKKKQEIRQQQYQELTNLTNAYTLEYETANKRVPASPDEQQRAARSRAESLNKESKNLLSRAAKSDDPAEKGKLLAQAARAGHAANKELARALPKSATNFENALNEIGGRINGETPAGTTAPPPVAAVPSQPRPAAGRGNETLNIEGLSVIRGNAYSAARPIPIDAPVQDGLIFRVQIGAFRAPLPDNSFKGLSPLNGETTPNGYYRYTAGNFSKYENANAVKNDLRGLGYGDAFVVAYFNGKRISIAEALDKLKAEGRTIDPAAPQSAGITANTNIPPAAANPVVTNRAEIANELEKVSGLLYTIQIGVYNKLVTKAQLMNLRPIYTEQLQGGLYRYTAGIYNNTDRLVTDKNRVIALGIRDAFVSAYVNGKKVSFAEAKNRQATDPNVRMEAENPVVFQEGGAAPAQNAAPAVAPEARPFTNGVSGYPAATAENGVKADETGVSFKVQIGAYSKQIPADVAARFNAIRNWPVESKVANNMYIYNAGNFTDARFARALRDELVRQGITDAFVTVYRDGKKLYGAEAAALIGR